MSGPRSSSRVRRPVENRTTVTDAHGIFVVPALLPELYRVEISVDGFKTLTTPT